MSENLSILAATQPWSHVLIDWAHLFLPVSLPVTGRVEEKVTCVPESLANGQSQGPEVPFDYLWTTLETSSSVWETSNWYSLRAVPG